MKLNKTFPYQDHGAGWKADVATTQTLAAVQLTIQAARTYTALTPIAPRVCLYLHTAKRLREHFRIDCGYFEWEEMNTEALNAETLICAQGHRSFRRIRVAGTDVYVVFCETQNAIVTAYTKKMFKERETREVGRICAVNAKKGGSWSQRQARRQLPHGQGRARNRYHEE